MHSDENISRWLSSTVKRKKSKQSLSYIVWRRATEDVAILKQENKPFKMENKQLKCGLKYSFTISIYITDKCSMHVYILYSYIAYIVI